jgi:hypothetical protein
VENLTALLLPAAVVDSQDDISLLPRGPEYAGFLENWLGAGYIHVEISRRPDLIPRKMGARRPPAIKLQKEQHLLN